MNTDPSQEQPKQPGREYKMDPEPKWQPFYQGRGRFKNQTVVISGGDSGIGRAIAVAFANEGAKVGIIFKEEEKDAQKTKEYVEAWGSEAHLIEGNVQDEKFCHRAIDEFYEVFGRVDILINNAAEQHVVKEFEEISSEQLHETYKTNIFPYFYLTQAALKYIPEHTGCIINTTSVTAYHGNAALIDYSSTKGAITAFTRSLAKNLVKKGIRVNGVAPGPIWTPLIPATFSGEALKSFGTATPMQRAGHPNEVAGCYTFLASLEASFMTGTILHPNGGEYFGG